jgi:hypothetical protein
MGDSPGLPPSIPIWTGLDYPTAHVQDDSVRELLSEEGGSELNRLLVNINQRFLRLLLADRGISFRWNTFLNQAFLAAHCLMSSRGKVKMVTAKKNRKKNLSSVPQ